MTSARSRVLVRTAVQVADYAPGATFGPRWLPDYELVWLLRGSAHRHHCRPDASNELGPEQVESFRPGTLALCRRGSREFYTWDPVRRSRHAYVHFDIDDPGPAGPEHDWPTARSMSSVPVLEGLCDYLLELAGSPSDQARRRSDEIVALVVDIFLNGPTVPEQETWPDGLLGLIDHVRATWDGDGMRIIDVAELAEAAQLSTGHLHRVFRNSWGCGPAHALELVRLARAATSLQRSNAPLSAVADATGFANPYHFSRRFRQTYGCPPGAFRSREESMDPLAPVRRAGLLPLAHRLL